MIRSKHVFALFALLAILIPAVPVARAADPTLTKVGPNTVSVGDPDFTLRVIGTAFDDDSVILLDGAPLLPTQFVSKKRLQALIPMTVTAATGTHTVAVRRGDGVTTASLTLTVGTKLPGVTIDRVNPDALGLITSGFAAEFRLSGVGFNDKSKVLIYGASLETTLREKGVLSVIVPNGFLSVPGILPIQVKADGGGLSNIFTVTVYDKPATITSLNPANVKAGAAAFEMKIDGAGFAQDAIVTINGVELTPTSIKSQLIKLMVPASAVTTVSEAVVYVVQSTGLSNAFILRITPANDNPFLYTVTPNEVQAGIDRATSVAVNGANFAEKSKVFLNGTEVKTTFIGKGRVDFNLSKENTATAGVTYQVQVRNNDGTVSNFLPVSVVRASVVSTLAGKSLDGFEDGDSETAKFRRPSRMAIGPDGFYYLADQQNNAIRRINPATGFTETIAGDGQPGYVDSGDSTDANFSVPRFNNPLGIAVAENGTIYVADYGNRVIRRVRVTGSGVTVDTVAGENTLIDDKDERAETKSTRRGLQGFGNGAGAVARFRGPDGMALASDGTLYVADATNQYIRAIDTTSSTFQVTTASGIGITGFTDGDGSTARYTFPLDVALTPDETGLVVADFGNNRVRLFDIASGSVSTIAGSGFEGTASGGPFVAQFRGPIGVTVGSDGTVYVTDNASNTIRRVSPEGNTTTLAGGGSRSKFKDGIGPDANFKDPRGILFDPAVGSVVVSDQGHQRLRKIVP